MVQLVEHRLSIRQIAQDQKCSAANVRYWLRKHGLKTKRGPHGALPRDTDLERQCSRCGESDSRKFYGNKRSTCAKCHNDDVTRKGRHKTRKAITFLGGKCRCCGFDKHQASLCFHHLDPTTKDPSFSSMRGWAWERIETELKKCVLLCMNCHIAIHAGELEFPGVAQSG